MLQKIRNWFRKSRKIAFLDGDQNIPSTIKAYTKYLANTGTEVHLIRMKPDGCKEPKALRNLDDTINKIYLSGYSTGKEVVDKFIAAYIQRAVIEGYDQITVVSSDYDFIDIFKMAVQVNPQAGQVTFRIIIPNVRGRLAELPEQVFNIEVIKCD